MKIMSRLLATGLVAPVANAAPGGRLENYPTNDANDAVNIDSTMELKVEAITKQVSQFEPAVTKDRPDGEPATLLSGSGSPRNSTRSRMREHNS